MLSWLGLEFTCRADVGQESNVDEQGIGAGKAVAHLPDGFEEWLPLNVAHRAANFDDHHVGIVFLADQHHTPLDLVGDVRNHLNRAAEIITASFLVDNVAVNLPCGDVARTIQAFVDEPLVVSKIEVGLRAISRNEDLTVLVRTHRARIDIEIRVEFLDDDFEPTRFENASDSGSSDALTHRTDHPTRTEDVFGIRH